MSGCNHCGETGQCQDDFHSGAGIFGGLDEAGQDHPGMFDAFFGSCPSCGDWNTNRRPACPHCDGAGRDDNGLFSNENDRSWGPSESVKEREYRESHVRSEHYSSNESYGGSSESVSSGSGFDSNHRGTHRSSYGPAFSIAIYGTLAISGLLWIIIVYDSFQTSLFEGILGAFLSPIALVVWAIPIFLVIWAVSALYIFFTKD